MIVLRVSDNSYLIHIKEMRTTVKISKEEDDPMALRVSWGGKTDFGFYFVFRGNLNEIKNLLRQTLDGIKNLKEEDFHDLTKNGICD